MIQGRLCLYAMSFIGLPSHRLRVAILASVSIAMALWCGCSRNAAPAGGKKRGQAPSFPVEVMTVEAKPQEVIVSAPGVVDAFERIQVTARVSGVIDKVMFAEGQLVKQGQVLANIDSRRYALAVSSARAALAKSEATAADNEQALNRRQTASQSNPGLIPGEELETYQTRMRTARADVDQAREAVKLAQLNLDDSNVKALAEGVIQTRSVETGQFVQAGTVIATLLRREPMLLRFSVSTAEAPRLKVGMPVEFTLKESQQTYSAKISLVAEAADPDSRLVPVTAEVQSEKKYWLRPGSFAQVQVKMTPGRVFPTIPQLAARPSDRGFLAYVVQGDTARERVLQLGLNTPDGWVEVRNGLSAGELLVVRGIEALGDGTKVQVMSPDGGLDRLREGADSGASAGRPPDGAGRGERSRGAVDQTGAPGGPAGSVDRARLAAPATSGQKARLPAAASEAPTP